MRIYALIPVLISRQAFLPESILCMPVLNKEGKTIGVSQVLNKRGGSFNQEDERKRPLRLLPKFLWESKMQNSLMMFKTRKITLKAFYQVCMTR